MQTFDERIRQIDDEVDEHVGDDMVLVHRGQRTPIRGTFSTEEYDQIQDGSVTTAIRMYASIQERFVPWQFSEGGRLERLDSHRANPVTEHFEALSVGRPHNGRVKVFLKRAKSQQSPIGDRSALSQNVPKAHR